MSFEPGDIWYFPKGHGHALQNISNEEAHFVPGFDDGHFSEFGTFSITDWVGHTSHSVVFRNLALSLGTIDRLPKKELYIPGKIPSRLPEPYLGDQLETPQNPHKFSLGKMAPQVFPGGWERIVTAKEFPINLSLTSVLLHLEPGAIRECTGIRMPMNGSTTSVAARESQSSVRMGEPEPKSLDLPKSVLFSKALVTTSSKSERQNSSHSLTAQFFRKSPSPSGSLGIQDR